MTISKKNIRLIIGIDFGTTFTGGAWALSGKPNTIRLVTSWPLPKESANFGSDMYKAPTQIRFPPANPTAPKWGFGIPPKATPLKWFKLLLLEEEDLPSNIRDSEHLAEARKLLKDEGITAVQAITGYLKAFWEHMLQDILRSATRQLMDALLFEVVITLPAIWPHYAQARMRQAAAAAGILDPRSAGPTELYFISEPEAAAIATFNDMGDRPDINVGDHFVVCDCGGGTVDIITYEIIGKEPLQMRESVRGDGRLCGGIFLDEAFIKLIKLKIGEDQWASYKPSSIKAFLRSEWDASLKKRFDMKHDSGKRKCDKYYDTNEDADKEVDIYDDDDDDEINSEGDDDDDVDDDDYDEELTVQLPSPDGKKSGFTQREIKLTRNELTSVFDPLCSEIESLVVDQIQQVKAKHNKAPKYVILAGGFGRCAYLHSKLNRSEGISTSSERIELIQDREHLPWTAICRGAVMRGLIIKENIPNTVQIESRVSRASYGVACQREFRPGVDDESKKFLCPLGLTYKVNSVEWFLKIGTNICDSKHITHRFYGLFDPDKHSTVQNVQILYSQASTPPTYRDGTCQRLCMIQWTNQNLERSPLWSNPDGDEFRQVWSDVKMMNGSASVDFLVLIDGAQVAAQNVDIMY